MLKIKNNRLYNYKDINMLYGASTIVKIFKTNIQDFTAYRNDWNDAYADGLSVMVDDAILKYTGLKPKLDLKTATQDLYVIFDNAYLDLSVLKSQIDTVVKARIGTEAKNSILIDLGFKANFVKARNKNQEAMSALLNTFKSGVERKYRQILIDYGINAVLIDRIVGYCEIFMDASQKQEYTKESSKEIPEEYAKLFNQIYTEVIMICKIGRKIYKFRPRLRNAFSFTKIVRAMGVKIKKDALLEEEQVSTKNQTEKVNQVEVMAEAS